MDYEQLQASTKDENRNLLLAFAAIIAVVAATAAAAVTATAWVTLRLIEVYVAVDASSADRVVSESELLTGRAPWGWIYLSVFAITASVIVWISHSREQALIAFGGVGIAQSMGGRQIDAVTTDSAERRFVNAVEEMAIAAGQPAPTVYVLDREPSINAFNAGWTSETTVIGVTRGALVELSREELQAIAAQAMSHVFHGDARLNLRLMALVTGVAGLAIVGEDWIERSLPESWNSRDSAVIPTLVAGYLLYGVGWIGVKLSSSVQRSVARRHELLADATAVQLLRQMAPMRDALRRIGGHPSSGRIRHRQARSTNHLFMVDAGVRRSGGVHPDMRLRVLRLDPSWSGDWLRAETSGLPPAEEFRAPASQPSSPLSPVADSIAQVPALEPLVPVFDAMSAPIAGFTDAAPPAATELLAPVMLATALNESGAPDLPDANQARCMVVALTHLATQRTPTKGSVPAPCDLDEVALMLDALRQAVADDRVADGHVSVGRVAVGRVAVDRVAMLADAGEALRGQDGTKAFATQAVVGLRVESDLDQWILQRLILGNLVPPVEPKKRRSLERLRSDYATVLSTLVAIGGGNTQAAFGVAVSRADLLGLHQRSPGKLSGLGKSLDKLSAMEPADHDRALSGLMGAVHADGESRRSELEFVEVVRVALWTPEPGSAGEPAHVTGPSWKSRLRVG